jgi:hypothetical protein
MKISKSETVVLIEYLINMVDKMNDDNMLDIDFEVGESGEFLGVYSQK